MKKLDFLDTRYLEAARGWLELGDYVEAAKELDEIRPRLRAHPDVLAIRFDIYSKANKWAEAEQIARAICRLAPGTDLGFVRWAIALHAMKRTQEAWDVLFPILEKFPHQYVNKLRKMIS